MSSQQWKREPSQLLLFQTVRRGVSQPVVGGAGSKQAYTPPPKTHTARWDGSWFSGMPSLLTQHWEFWLSAFWEMSGLRETDGSHSGHPSGGRQAEKIGNMREQGPVCRKLSVRGLCTGVRAEEDNCQVKKGVYRCKGVGRVPGCECLKQRVDVQSGWAPRAWQVFSGKTCVQRRGVEHAGGRNVIRKVCRGGV